MPNPTTPELVAEFIALRGPYGEAPADESPQARVIREDRLADLYRQLQALGALPPLVSRGTGFAPK